MAKDKKNKTPSISEVFRSDYQYKNTDPEYKDAYNIDRGLMVMDALMDRYPNMTLEQAAGVAGNFGIESYFNPAVQQGQGAAAKGKVLGDGVGLAQWSNVRRKALMEMFPGNQWKSLDNQMKFLMHENATTERKNWDKVLQQKTPEDAARVFVQSWERAGTPHLDKRMILAKTLYDRANEFSRKQLAQRMRSMQEQQQQGLWDKIVGGVKSLWD